MLSGCAHVPRARFGIPPKRNQVSLVTKTGETVGCCGVTKKQRPRVWETWPSCPKEKTRARRFRLPHRRRDAITFCPTSTADSSPRLLNMPRSARRLRGRRATVGFVAAGFSPRNARPKIPFRRGATEKKRNCLAPYQTQKMLY